MTETKTQNKEIPAGLPGEMPARAAAAQSHNVRPRQAEAASIGQKAGGSNRWRTAISLTALAFSGISLYETEFKQARPAIYISDMMVFGRDADNRDAIVLPVTVANHGSRDTVVIRLRLTVRRQGAAEVRTMSSVYSGDTPKVQRLFTPIPIAGHNSSAGSVVFIPADDQGRIFEKGTYEFCLTIQAETGDYPAISGWLPAFRPASLRFQAVFPALAEGQLSAGNTLPLRAENAEYSTPSCRFP